MGWFWADASPKPVAVLAPQPVSETVAAGPSQCPVGGKSSPLSQKISSQVQQRSSSLPSSTAPPSSCPVKSPSQSSRYPSNPTIPIESPTSPQATQQKSSAASSSPSQQSSWTSSWSASLNPLNFMPAFRNERPDDSPQTVSLPLEREMSTIPRGDSESMWEYPSPQQMYNAMLRKGYTDTPAEHVESMVAVHNFLNEGAWNEIVEWEGIFSSGLGDGWAKCRRGEQGIALERARRDYVSALQAEQRRAAGVPSPYNEDESEDGKPRLLRFQGKPDQPTPKARILQYLGRVFPERFGSEPPFDRHDWFVARAQPDGGVKEVRYVIDYYGGGLQATGEPVFYLDIRPALDTPTAAAERLVRWGGDVWWRASGAEARELEQKKKRREQQLQQQ